MMGSSTDINKVVDYYNQCFIGYRSLMGVNNNLSLHFGFYDQEHKKYNDAVINMNNVLAETIKIASNDEVLDLGCGFGGSVFWLAKEHGVNVVGIDINERQVKIGRELVKKNNLDHLAKFHVKDFMNTGFPDNSFDVIWSIESISYADSKEEFLLEAKRMLKVNGRIIFADCFPKKEYINITEEKCMNKWLQNVITTDIVSIDEYRTYLEEAGFKDIKFRDITKNVVPCSRYLYMLSIFIRPLQKIFELMGMKKEMLFLSVNSAYYRHLALKKNLWRYGIFYARKQ